MITKICENCKEEFKCYPSQENRIKCCSRKCCNELRKGKQLWNGSRKEVNKWLNKFQFEKGDISHNKGKTKEDYLPLKIVGEKNKERFRKNPKLGIIQSKRMKENNPMKNKDVVKKVFKTLKNKYYNNKDWLKKKSLKQKELFKNNPKIGIKIRNSNIINGTYKRISVRMKNGGAMKARMGNNKAPNKPEKKLIKFFKDWKMPLEFVGDGQKWFTNRNKHFNPDFIDKKNKIIVEFDGKHWHNEKFKDDTLRNETYNNYGYKILSLNEDDLNDKTLLMNKMGGLCQ